MTNSYRVLHIEDSPDDAELVGLALRKAPFAFAYTRVQTQADYLRELDAAMPDVILCDHELPDFSARLALEIMKARRLDVPFIVISHHDGHMSTVVAMQNGASDYLPMTDLDRLCNAIQAAVERGAARVEKASAREELRVSESMRRSILDSLTSRIALIDGRGVILAVNKAWTDFASSRTLIGLGRAELGDNYCDMLRERAATGNDIAQSLFAGIRGVIERKTASFALEYPMQVGAEKLWYRGCALPPEGSEQGAVVSHADITARVNMHIELEQAHQRMRILSKRVLSAQEDERRTISRELHDDIGQSLAALKIGLYRVAPQSMPWEADLVEQCVGIADDVLEKLRQLALELRPPQLDQLGLGDALTWLAARQRGATGIDIRCDVGGLESRRPPATLEIACYRIVQEALSNATRHAQAKAIVIAASSDGSLLKLSIRDDGVGFDPEAARMRALDGSLGLISMEERADLAGGRLTLCSVLGGGTTLSVVFPLGGEEPRPAIEPREAHA
ncbi:MAG: ATP-binding protein [Usitatibacter sp.]